MKNVIRGEHTIELNGEEYVMCLDMDAFTEACAVLDCGINALMGMLEGNDPKPHVIRALVYGAMKRHNELALKDVMTFVVAYGLPEMTTELQKLAQATMPESAPGNGNAGKGQKPSPPPKRKSKTSGGGKKKP